jgi:cysteine-rich repeat protein
VQCGDGRTNSSANEQCDDANAVNGDGCDSNCKLTGCGNGIVTAGEACDDGNNVNGDGCDSGCVATGCGNGIPTAGEQCDTGGQTAACDADCTLAICGDGTLNTSGVEVCDDQPYERRRCENRKPTACGNAIATVRSLRRWQRDERRQLRFQLHRDRLRQRNHHLGRGLR